jgi:hypothetical protein
MIGVVRVDDSVEEHKTAVDVFLIARLAEAEIKRCHHADKPRML